MSSGVFAIFFFAICLAVALELAVEAIWLVMQLFKRGSRRLPSSRGAPSQRDGVDDRADEITVSVRDRI